MSKNFKKDGRWIENPSAPAVVECPCGNKYIKTRKDQTACLRCSAKKGANAVR